MSTWTIFFAGMLAGSGLWIFLDTAVTYRRAALRRERQSLEIAATHPVAPHVRPFTQPAVKGWEGRRGR